MKLFEFLDKLYEKSDFVVPVNIPKKVEGKCTDVKEYKRQYYLKNIEIYKERNKKYRIENREEILKKAREKRSKLLYGSSRSEII